MRSRLAMLLSTTVVGTSLFAQSRAEASASGAAGGR
jgi:hypothetical protein